MRWLIAVVSLSVLVSTQPGFAKEKGELVGKRGKYITVADKEFRYQIKGLGTFRVLKIGAKGGSANDCFVSVDGLKRATQESMGRSKGKVSKGVTVEVDLQKEYCEWRGPNGEVERKICCDGGGTGCTVMIEVEEVSAESSMP